MAVQGMKMAYDLQPIYILIPRHPPIKIGSRWSFLRALPVMLNAVSYIICRYQTEQSILKRIKGAPSDNASLCNQFAFSMPDRANNKGTRLADLMPTRHPNKDGINLIRVIKTKRQPKINLQLPFFSSIFKI